MAEARRVCPTCGAGYGGDALFCPKDGAPLGARKPHGDKDPYSGLLLPSGIQLERLVGIGAMGRVYRAREPGLDRSVAVKILHREHTKNPTFVGRFQREGRVAGSLVHPNVIVVHGAGELPPHASRCETPGGVERTDGEPYLVTEFLDGLTLRSALAAGEGALPLFRSLRIVLQACDAMGTAHAAGVVHRDLKPENLMLVRVGEDPDFVKVVDFGVARVGDADTSLATHAGAVLGTATYACPESARGDRVGPEGDVYALATILFECLAGRAPFVGAGPVDVLIQHAQATPPDVRSLPRAKDVPDAFARLLRRNLEKKPSDRCRNARELGHDLLRAAREAGLDTEALGRSATLGAPRQAGKSKPEATTLLAGSPERSALRDLGSPRGTP